MYITSPITVFDEDKELFETHIGLDNEERTLLLSAWGRTEAESRMCAEGTIERLNFSMVNVPEDLRQYPLSHPDMIQPHEAIKR